MTTIDQTFQQLAENHELATARYWELLRGGLPSNSLPGGARGAEMPLPAMDRFDRTLQQTWAQYQSWLRIAMATSSRTRRATAIHNAARIQTWFLLKPDPIEDIMCDQPHCTNLLELGRKSGKCAMHRMREYRKRKKQQIAG
jgi:hypothetical protein